MGTLRSHCRENHRNSLNEPLGKLQLLSLGKFKIFPLISQWGHCSHITRDIVNVPAISWAGELQGNPPGKFWMYLGCTGLAHAQYIIHFLAVTLQCTGSVHCPLSPVSRSLDPNDEESGRWSPSEPFPSAYDLRSAIYQKTCHTTRERTSDVLGNWWDRDVAS